MQQNPIQRFEDLFEQFRDEFEYAPMSLSGGISTPAVDLAEADGEFVVVFNLPGFESDDIDLRITDHTLHLHAEHGGTEEIEEQNFIHRERKRSDVSRTVTLPEDVDEDSVSASYEHGVLTVTLPKESGGVQDDGGHRISVA